MQAILLLVLIVSVVLVCLAVLAIWILYDRSTLQRLKARQQRYITKYTTPNAQHYAKHAAAHDSIRKYMFYMFELYYTQFSKYFIIFIIQNNSLSLSFSCVTIICYSVSNVIVWLYKFIYQVGYLTCSSSLTLTSHYLALESPTQPSNDFNMTSSNTRCIYHPFKTYI